nr:MAG TPA: hypothetical protein [Caudoviricetes sp.]
MVYLAFSTSESLDFRAFQRLRFNKTIRIAQNYFLINFHIE